MKTNVIKMIKARFNAEKSDAHYFCIGMLYALGIFMIGLQLRSLLLTYLG